VIIVTTSGDVAGATITGYLGIVRGIIVRTPNIGQGLMGGIETMFGGRNDTYTGICEQTRVEATEAMVEHAQSLGAHAVIAMRYDSTELQAGMTEVLAYGTAVTLQVS
jgi:uncharacterized protein YbjQ (UPF0145 family)